jgi:hypothetical protein
MKAVHVGIEPGALLGRFDKNVIDQFKTGQ